MDRKLFTCLRSIKLSVTAVLLIILSATSPLLSDTNTACDPQDMRTLFSERIKELTETKQSLVKLLRGQRLENVSVESLFSIDVLNENQAKQLIREIDAYTPTEFEKQYPECTHIKKDMASLFNRIQDLEIDISKLKKKFLKLPLSQRRTLLKLSQMRDQEALIEDDLKKEQAVALKEYRIAVESIERMKQIISETENDESEYARNTRKLADGIVLFHKRMAEIANIKLEMSEQYERQLAQFNDYQDKINTFSHSLTKKLSLQEVEKNYKKLSSLWRTLIDMGISTEGTLDFPLDDDAIKVPKRMRENDNADQKLLNEYRESYTLLERRIDEIRSVLSLRRQNIIKIHYKTVTNASSIRSEYIQKLVNTELTIMDPMDHSFWMDILRELKVVPYRFISLILTRLVEFKHYLQEGISGVFAIIKALLNIIIFILIPFGVFFVIKKGTDFINEIRKKVIYEKHPSRIKIKLSLWLQTLSPYLPYLVVYASISFIDYLLEGSLVQDLSILLPYVRMYIIYRLFILFFMSILQKIVIRSRLRNIAQYELRIQKTTKIIGIYFLTVFAILYTAESTVGKALVYIILEYVFVLIGIIVFLRTVFSWRNEIANSLKNNFKSSFIHRIASAGSGIKGFILLIPLLIILTVKLSIVRISQRIFELDFAKKASARFIRRQMEVAGAKIQETDIVTLPEEYKNLFSLNVPSDPDLFINPDSGDFNKCSKIIREWENGDTDETSLAIYGEKGIGKSSLLEQLKNTDGNYIKISVSVPPKIITADDSLNFFQESLSFDFNGAVSSIRQWDEKRQKTVLYLDDAHNFFLSTIGGFQGFKVFLELINAGVKNLFVCATFNIHSWMYLDSVFGKNRYFRNILGLSLWSEDDIRSLILKRHEKSDYTLSYDPVISAGAIYSEHENLDNTDKNFFRLLWEQSDGNPRTAIYSWLTCIKPADKKLHVGLPRDPEGEIFNDLQADALFVYAAVVKHENLTTAEVINATSLPHGLVSYSLKIGLERGFLERDTSGRYRVHPGWHGTVINYLMERNLLYVN